MGIARGNKQAWTHWGMLIVGATVAVGMVVFAGRAQGAEQPALYKGASAAAVKTAAVAEGQIVANLNYTGDLKAASQVSVLPKASGRIEKLLVDVGSRVKKGDTLAELDSGALKAQVSQATANLAAAQAKYDNLQAGSRPEQIAQAKANLDSAKAKLAAMQAGGRDEQVAQAQAAVDAAKARADQVRSGAKETDLAALQSQVDAASGNLAAARAQLEQVKQGPTQTQWWQALGQLDAARANMKAAEAHLADVKAGPKKADIAAAEAAVVQARAQVAAIDDLKNLLDEPAELRYAAGATSAEKVNRQAAAAQAAADATQAKLDLLRSMPLPADLQAAQSAYDAAKAGYDTWSNAVDQMKRGVTAEDIRKAQGAVEAAGAAVAGAQARLQQAKDGATADDLTQVEAAVTQAEQALALAQKPFRQEDLVQARAGVTVAEQGHSLAQNPYTQQDMAMAQAGVQQAQAAVELVELALSEAVVVSPIDGVVADKFQSVGALVSPANPIVALVSGDVEMVLGVEESQIGQIAEGQKAEISVAAYPGTVFPAKVTLIGPVADPKSRTFTVKVKPEANDGKLKQGMFAQAKIVTQEKDRAVLVPKEAVVTKAGQSSIFVLKGDTVEMRQVSLGLRQNGTVEVVSGLAAGEEIVVAGQNDLRDGDRVMTASSQ